MDTGFTIVVVIAIALIAAFFVWKANGQKKKENQVKSHFETSLATGEELKQYILGTTKGVTDGAAAALGLPLAVLSAQGGKELYCGLTNQRILFFTKDDLSTSNGIQEIKLDNVAGLEFQSGGVTSTLDIYSKDNALAISEHKPTLSIFTHETKWSKRAKKMAEMVPLQRRNKLY